MKKLGLMDLTVISRNPGFMRMGMRLIQANLWAGANPLVRRFHPWFDDQKTNMYWIPINETIEQNDNVPVPQDIVRQFIEHSSYRSIVDFCGCRQSFECKHYPTEIGCLMMGEDAKQLNSKISRPVSKEEAVAHLDRAVKAGLPPFVGKARIDDFVFGIRNSGRLLTVCFCCECCCLTRWFKYTPTAERGALMHRLEGLDIRVDADACEECHTCAEHCFLDLISFDNGTAQVAEECMGCGRCVAACPHDAIHLSLNNPEFVDQAMKSIGSYVKP